MYKKINKKLNVNVKSNIVDQFGIPMSSTTNIHKKLFTNTIPAGISESGVKFSGIATDSDSYAGDLPVNDNQLYNNSLINNAYISDIITTFAGWGLLSQVSQNPIVRNIIRAKANTANHKWGKLVYRGKDGHENASKKLSILTNRFQELNLRENIKLAHSKDVLFGGCMMYPHISGINSNDQLINEFDVSEIKGRTIKYLKIIEPIYITPQSFQASDPLAKNFYIPEIWNAMGRQIHISRLMHFVSDDTPVIIKPTFNFFSQSLINLILDYLGGWERMRNNVLNIVDKYNVNIFKTDLTAILGNGDPTANDVNSVKNRIALYNKIRDNFGVLLMDKEGEEWAQYTMNLTSLDKLLQQNLEYVASVTQIPATMLFSQSPSGFGSSGQLETETFELLIRGEQNTELLPHIDHVTKLLQYEQFGEYDPNIEFEFNSLSEPTAKEKAEIFMIYVQGFSQLTGKAILTPEEARQKIAETEELGFGDLDIEANISNLEDTGESDDSVDNDLYDDETPSGIKPATTKAGSQAVSNNE